MSENRLSSTFSQKQVSLVVHDWLLRYLTTSQDLGKVANFPYATINPEVTIGSRTSSGTILIVFRFF